MKYASGLMFSEDRTKLAMVLKSKPAWQCGLFNLVGGKIEEGEAPEVAVAREFQEETGVISSPSEWEYFTMLDGEWGQVYFYRMFDDRVLNVTTMEEEMIQLIDPLRIPQNVVGNVRWLVPMAMDLQTLTPRIIKHMG